MHVECTHPLRIINLLGLHFWVKGEAKYHTARVMITVTPHGGAILAICVLSGVLLCIAESSDDVMPCPHGAAMCSEKGREAAAALCPFMASKRAASAVAKHQWLVGVGVGVAAVATVTWFVRGTRQPA
jgi:hypothetical protein